MCATPNIYIPYYRIINTTTRNRKGKSKLITIVWEHKAEEKKNYF